MKAKLLKRASDGEGQYLARDWFYPFVEKMYSKLSPLFPDGLKQRRAFFVGPEFQDPPTPEFQGYHNYYIGQVMFSTEYVKGEWESHHVNPIVLQATFPLPEPGQEPLNKIYLQLVIQGPGEDMEPPEAFEALEDLLIIDRWIPHVLREFQMTKIVDWK